MHIRRPVAHVAELADACVSEAHGETRGGSSPLVSTISNPIAVSRDAPLTSSFHSRLEGRSNFFSSEGLERGDRQPVNCRSNNFPAMTAARGFVRERWYFDRVRRYRRLAYEFRQQRHRQGARDPNVNPGGEFDLAFDWQYPLSMGRGGSRRSRGASAPCSARIDSRCGLEKGEPLR
jgi:hypothetical protein